MCLELTERQLKPRIAKKDIVVWKVGYSIYGQRIFYSCYKNFEYTLNKKVKSRVKVFENWCSAVIDIGLHSFKLKRDALFLIKEYMYDENVALAKCIIPKGTKYWIGDFGGDISYASEALIVKKIIK